MRQPNKTPTEFKINLIQPDFAQLNIYSNMLLRLYLKFAVSEDTEDSSNETPYL